MALAEKIDRKQLKRPDEFQVVAGKAMEWVAAHQKKVLLAAGAVVLLVVAAWALSAWRGARETKAAGDLALALEQLSRPLAGEAQPGQETFASREERTKAALAALEKVRTDHAGTKAAQTALAEMGFLKLKTGDAAGAQKDLSDFLSGAGRDHPLRIFAQESLGYAYEAQGKLDEARAAFEMLRELGMPARADFQAARLALLQNKPDAKQQLERIGKEYPKDTEVVREANKRLELAALPPVTPGSIAPTPNAVKPARKPATAPAEKPQGKTN
jgi:tetratricopeptide (TPR) repeat protein